MQEAVPLHQVVVPLLQEVVPLLQVEETWYLVEVARNLAEEGSAVRNHNTKSAPILELAGSRDSVVHSVEVGGNADYVVVDELYVFRHVAH